MGKRRNRTTRQASTRGLSNGDRRYIERTLAEVERDRCTPVGSSDIAEIIAAYGSPDPQVRADALRRSCACRVPWEIYDRLRKEALRLRNDPVARVRYLANHLEDDARMIRTFEARSDALTERDEKIAARRADRTRRPRRSDARS